MAPTLKIHKTSTRDMEDLSNAPLRLLIIVKIADLPVGDSARKREGPLFCTHEATGDANGVAWRSTR